MAGQTLPTFNKSTTQGDIQTEVRKAIFDLQKEIKNSTVTLLPVVSARYEQTINGFIGPSSTVKHDTYSVGFNNLNEWIVPFSGIYIANLIGNSVSPNNILTVSVYVNGVIELTGIADRGTGFDPPGAGCNGALLLSKGDKIKAMVSGSGFNLNGMFSITLIWGYP